ncbi:protein of unknown function [Filomicrobium insigne]|uniref:DUF4384 domain-containing protein n=1 Tax=Filomicrobium insigne TaxID=418854 RepID=A0A1H0T6V6_9HYPH|nr:protein of unknown function [Filomicrobium insigne]
MVPGAQRRKWLAVAVLVALGCLVVPCQAQDQDPPAVLAPSAASDAVRAYKVLDQHCARCHQTGRLKRSVSAGDLGNVLDLDALARRADLVRPGYPDASPLFTVMQTRHMPNDVTNGFGDLKEPSVEEIAAVRTWIAGLRAVSRCVWGVTDTEDVDALIRADQQGADPETARFRRYVQLSHLGTSCGGKSQLDAYRQALVKLLNSVSRAPKPLRPDNVDIRGSFIAFDVRNLGWSPDEWEAIAKQTPEATRPDLGSDILEGSGSRQPLLRADWLAYALSEPGNYYARLRIPVRERNFDAWLGFTGNIDLAQTRVAGVAQSAVTGAARTFLRRADKDGRVLWEAFDFVPGTGEQSDALTNLSNRLSRGAGDDVAAGAEQSRLLFQLPNGFFGSAVFSADGTRRDEAKEIGTESHVSELAGRATGGGLGCFVCHQPVLLPFQDDLRGIAMEEVSQSGGGANHLVSQAELDALLANDANAQTIVLRSAGIGPDLTIDGLEPIHALVLNYLRALDIRRVAREMGRSVQQISQTLEKLDGDLAPAARRLRQGVITRAEFDWLASELVEDTDQRQSIRPHADDLRLSLWSDKPSYKAGEAAYFFASSTQDCHLTLISVDAKGLATVLFPNDFNPDNLLKARQRLRVPGPADEFRFRLRTVGEEMIVGICMAGGRTSPPGVFHDFERQRFTSLGDWEAFLRDELAADSKERAGGGTVQRAKLVSGRKRRDTVPARSDPTPLPQARDAIVIKID